LASVALLFSVSIASAQLLEETQNDFRHGKYESVAAAAQKKVAAGDYQEGWRILLVKSLLTLGRYQEAQTNAQAGLDNYSGRLELRLLTDLFQNDVAGANRQLTEIKLLIEQRGLIDRSGDNLVPLGNALLLLGVEPRLVLENCFQRAEQLDPPLREAFIASGQLALDKHDFKLAADAFRAGLKKFPEDPDMEAGLAKSFASNDGDEMKKALEAALAINPRHIPSYLILADHLIDAEQYDAAEKELGEALAVNPAEPEALAYRAVLAHLRNDTNAEQQFRADALKHWKTNPEVDYLIGKKLAEKYLFAEAAAAERRALDFEPDYLPARRQLAEDLLRLGQDAEGWKLAQEAHAEDQYDVTSYNLVTLHDQMAKYKTLTNQDFILRMSREEADLYGDRALDLLTRAKATLCRKYGVELTRPTVVEIFAEQKDFAVRTFGMPGNPGYLGVCFGSVITANSPASQAPNPANWEDVLWHEFCHVVTLNDTKNRMPRWFSEGISVYEERQADPTWGERMSLAYRDFILNGELTPLGELSGAFLTPKNSEHLQFAYYESSLVIEFIVQKYGFAALKQILTDLGAGQEINKSIAAHTTPLPDLEKQFAAFAGARARALAPLEDIEKPPDSDNGAENLVWEKLHPNNYYLRIRKAEDLMKAKKWAEAKPVLESLAESYAGERRADNPLWLLAIVQRNLDDTNAEYATLQKFAGQESDLADMYIRLTELSQAKMDWPSAAKYAEKLLAINPLIPLPYRALALAGVNTGNNDQAINAYRKLLLLNPTDASDVHYQLARLLHARGDGEAEAERQVLQALEDAPRFRDAQRLLLEIETSAAKKENAAAAKPAAL
jgi:tetratricopeptide (TPR) repeat protein